MRRRRGGTVRECGRRRTASRGDRVQRFPVYCGMHGRDVGHRSGAGSGAEHGTDDHELHAEQRQRREQRRRERDESHRRNGSVVQRNRSDVSGGQRDTDYGNGAGGSFQREDFGGDGEWVGDFRDEFFGDAAGTSDFEFFAHQRRFRDKRERDGNGIHGRDEPEVQWNGGDIQRNG